MKLNIALLAGDGIGPEVIDQAVKVSNAIAKKFNHKIDWVPGITGAAAIDEVGEPYPDQTHEIGMLIYRFYIHRIYLLQTDKACYFYEQVALKPYHSMLALLCHLP